MNKIISLKKQRKAAIAEFERRADELLGAMHDERRRRWAVILVRDINTFAEHNGPRLTEKQRTRLQRLRETVGQEVFGLIPSKKQPAFAKGDRVRVIAKPDSWVGTADAARTTTGTLTGVHDDRLYVDYIFAGSTRYFDVEVIESVAQREERARAAAGRAQRRHERRKKFLDDPGRVRGLVWIQGDTCYYEVWANGKRVFADDTGVKGFDKIVAACNRRVCVAREVIGAGHTLPAFDDLS